MRYLLANIIGTLVLPVFLVAILAAGEQQPQQTQSQVQVSPQIIREVQHDTSLPLRELILMVPSSAVTRDKPQQAIAMAAY